jgi:uncharacterized protein YjbI with pentapeptide repeats
LARVTQGGFSAAHLYSTADNQEKNLRGKVFNENIFDGWNFAGIDLAETRLEVTSLRNASFQDANLTGNIFFDANLLNAKLTGAQIRGARFSHKAGFSAAQLASTASFQERGFCFFAWVQPAVCFRRRFGSGGWG